MTSTATSTTTAAMETEAVATSNVAANATTAADSTATYTAPDQVERMIQACSAGHMHVVTELVGLTEMYARQQDVATGMSPLMAAAAAGNGALVQHLLELGAPWNALDRQGQCAGDHATRHQHWGVVQLLVDWGTRSELILGMVQRGQRDASAGSSSGGASAAAATTPQSNRPVEHEPCTKPDFLRQRLRYTADGKALIDQDDDGVMMEWERPLMQAHAQMLMHHQPAQQQQQQQQSAGEATSNAIANTKKRVLNVGFGMGIIDTALQAYQPELHIIIEAHPDVYQKMRADGWDRKPGVRICFGKWQDVVPQLVAERVQVDGIFYDTYGEHFLDLEDFHQSMVHLLSKPAGIYSFFNGLAPDNLFFHGVACQCVKLQLQQLGLDVEFMPCEIQVPNAEWEGIRRKYWHGRDTYYLPHVTWNAQYLASGGKVIVPSPYDDINMEAAARKNRKQVDSSNDDANDSMEVETGDDKRQRRG